MSIGKHMEAEMIRALKQLEAGHKAEDVAREVGVSKHTIYVEGEVRRHGCEPGGSGLDNLFPFDTEYSTNDNPQVSVSSGATRVVLADSFTMYLMWQASIPNVNTIQVPLGYVNWSIQGAEDNSSYRGCWSPVTVMPARVFLSCLLAIQHGQR